MLRRSQLAQRGVAMRPKPWREVQFGVHDFTTLYPSLPHQRIVDAIRNMVTEAYAHHATTAEPQHMHMHMHMHFVFKSL